MVNGTESRTKLGARINKLALEVMRLRGALNLALDEIHNPGAARSRNMDVVAVIENALAHPDNDARQR